MNNATLARLASLMLAVQMMQPAHALCRPDANGCGCGAQLPICLVPSPPPEPEPPPPAPAKVTRYVGPAQGIVDSSNRQLWLSPDVPTPINPLPTSSTQVAFRTDVPLRDAGTTLRLGLDTSQTWASMTTLIDLSLQMNGHSLTLTNTDLPAGSNALSVLSGQTRLLNGRVQADAGNVRVGSGNSAASLVLDSGAQLLLEGPALRSVLVGTGGFGHDGLLRLQGGSLLRADKVLLGSALAAASGRLELDGSATVLDIASLTVGGAANGANATVAVRNGATLRTQALTVARHAGTTGEVTVDGAGSLLALRGGAVNIGPLADGGVTVSGGARLIGEASTLITVGNGDPTQSSVLRLQGAGTLMADIGVQVLPSGTLELRDGARWDAGSHGGANALAVQAGIVRFRGAQATLDTALVLGMGTEVISADGTPRLDVTKTGQWDIGNASTVVVDSLVSVGTAAQLLVHDTGTTFSFSDMVLNGLLSVHNGAELRGQRIGLGGHGQIGGNLGRIHADVIGTDGRITPGNSPGRLEIDGNVTLSGQASLELEIAGTQAGTLYDVLQVSGNFQMTGGRVVLKFLDGFAPKPGDSFDLLQVAGTLALDSHTPVQVQGLQAGWQFDLQADNGRSLRLVSLNQGVSAVPEPAGWLLWLLGVAVLGVGLKGRHRRH